MVDLLFKRRRGATSGVQVRVRSLSRPEYRDRSHEPMRAATPRRSIAAVTDTAQSFRGCQIMREETTDMMAPTQFRHGLALFSAARSCRRSARRDGLGARACASSRQDDGGAAPAALPLSSLRSAGGGGGGWSTPPTPPISDARDSAPAAAGTPQRLPGAPTAEMRRAPHRWRRRRAASTPPSPPPPPPPSCRNR